MCESKINKEIMINLDESSNAKSFVDSVIHQEQYLRVLRKIENRLPVVEEYLKKKDDDYFNKVNMLDTITVLGTRGSGKTSFLLSIAEFCKQKLLSNNSDDALKKIHDNISGKVEVIDIIDPTLIEEKGHIFLTIIASICKKVDAKLDAKSAHIDECEKGSKKEWKQCLKRLAGGLPTIDGIGGSMTGWDDPEHIMNKGLSSVQSASDLAENFHKLVNKALKILGKQAFILMFDDIDIDFLRGWPVLESIRKYLTTPQLLIFVSGDIHLFSKAIRKKQWKNFGKALLKNEGEQLDKMIQYNNTVTEMESQYLQKVLKPENRVTLTTLLEKFNMNQSDFRDTVKIKIKKTNAHPERVRTLIEEYNHILTLFGIYNSYQQDAYRSYLLSLPLRSQIQFLIQFTDCEKIEDVKSDCIDVFLSDLYEKNVDIEFAKSSPKHLCSTILKLLVNTKELDTAYQLQPTTADQSLNGCLMAFTMLFGIHSNKYPYLIFDYLIKIGYIRNLLSQLGYSTGSTEVSTKSAKSRNIQEYSELSIEGLIKHASLYTEKNYRDSMCYVTSYVRAFKDKSMGKTTLTPYVGTLCLYLDVDNREDALEERKETLITRVNSNETLKQIGLIPASKLKNSSNNNLLFYSVYNLLGAITEVIKVHSISSTETFKHLLSMAQLRAYPIPIEGLFKTDDVTLEPLSDNGQDSSTSQYQNDLSDLIIKWIEEYTSLHLNVSPHLLGKIATRIYYSIESIEGSCKDSNLWDYFNKYVIAIMNAVVVEEANERHYDLVLGKDNPVSNSKVFDNNLSKILIYQSSNKTEANDVLPLSKWILSSPLLLSYIKKTDSCYKQLMIFLEEELRLFVPDDLEIPIRYSWGDSTHSSEKKSEKDKEELSNSSNQLPKFTIQELKKTRPENINYEKLHELYQDIQEVPKVFEDYEQRMKEMIEPAFNILLPGLKRSLRAFYDRIVKESEDIELWLQNQ